MFAVQQTWAGHPLITEDTATQGQGHWQLEATYNRQRNDGSVETEDGGLVLSYGAADPLDLILTVPVTRLHQNGGGATHSKVGDIEIGAKWRFFEDGDNSLALRPGLTFATGDEDAGFGTGRSTASVFLVASHEPKPWAFHLHLGYTRNRNVRDERRSIWHYSVAATRRFGDRLQLVGDISRETNPEKGPDGWVDSAVLGVIYSATPDFDVDAGYRNGLSSAAPDDALLFGLTWRF
jgi:hypothetical protein